MEGLYRSLPRAPNADVKTIRGNLSDEEKQLNANIIAFFISGRGGRAKVDKPFAVAIGDRLRIVGINIWEREGGEAEAELVLEIQVTEDMCNIWATMHGACASYLVDDSTMAVMTFLGRSQGFEGGGVSQTMNIYWHTPASLGDTITVTARSLFADKRSRLARCEIRNKSSGRLVVSATHAFLYAGGAARL